MAYNYLVPRIAVLPAGFDCTVAPPLDLVGALLLDGSGNVDMTVRVTHENVVIKTWSCALVFAEGKLQGERPKPFEWSAEHLRDEVNPGFLELDFRTSDPTFPK